ncbi:hypothetical protein [Aeoliella sp.]|uniref:hypothetical protein n=1 Tax=Aeoliella sp. TaxID=2795800 RepID=UPI003CCB9376
MKRLLLALLALVVGNGCSRQSDSSPKPPIRSLEDIRQLPVGISVQHNPNPAHAVLGGRSGRKYTWPIRTTVSAINEDVTIIEFGAFVEWNGEWVFSTLTGEPFTPQDFAEWYSCEGASLSLGEDVTDPNNWGGGDKLMDSKAIWYFIGETKDGKRCYGEGEIVELGQLVGE